MNNIVKLAEMLEEAFNDYDSAELEIKLVDELDKQVKTDSTGLEAKLESYVNQLDAPELKALRGTADVQLIKFRVAMNKVAKLSPANRRSTDLQEALDAIAAAKAKCTDLDTLLAQGRDLLNGVKDLREKADLWEKDKLRYALRDELDGIRRFADEAINQAKAGDIVKALQTYEKAMELLVDGEVKKKMAGNEVPDLAHIQKIIARKDGDKQLDAMIMNLDESAQRKVIRVAFEARFGCELQMLHNQTFDMNRPGFSANMVRNNEKRGMWITSDEDKKSPDLKRFYEVMSKLPPKHTRDNDKLMRFAYRDSDNSGSSWAWQVTKEIVMNEGRADKSGIYGCGRPDEMPEDLKEVCKPKNDEPITYFDWNTAHEVGHTLDAKLNFMKSRLNQSKFGGWREYGTDSSEVAEALIKHYDYAPNYVRELLKGNAPPAIPDVRPGVDEVEWNRRKSLVDAHYERMKAGKNPWASQATAVSLAIDGRVYQQSYDAPSWSSYELSARREAISGYQFRSPLEWFSELYAAYKSDKLQDGHPAMEWLKRLELQ